MRLCSLILRSFARSVKPLPKPEVKVKPTLSSILRDQQFLSSIGIDSFPVPDTLKVTGLIPIYNESEELIGEKSIENAKSLAKDLQLDLLIAQLDPLVLQVLDFKKLVMKKIRLAQNKENRRALKEHVRNITLRNTITGHDLSIKLSKVEQLMAEHWKVVIFIESRIQSKAEIDRSRILAYEIEKALIKESGKFECQISEEDEGVFLKLMPDQKRVKLLDSIVGDKAFFESEKFMKEYQRIHRNLEQYQQTQLRDPEQSDDEGKIVEDSVAMPAEDDVEELNAMKD